ncbi:MAG: sodium/glutamate symporter [Lachnospiraceae bacterium]|nr:sodium/glutamate symporter [Lachnospiraceae bacterium]
MNLSLDMYQTLGIAVIVLLIGGWLRKKIRLLDRFCIPAPVIGGLLYALIMTLLHGIGVLDLEYDDTLKNVCMVAFFTTVGFQADFKALKKGGKSLVVFLILVVILIFAQNGLALGVSSLIGVDSLLGLCTGSIPMIGGHGTAGAFGPILEDFGMQSATTICTAAATFGLVAGSLMGGPVGQRLIKKHNLYNEENKKTIESNVSSSEEVKTSLPRFASATYQLAIAMSIGTVISWLLSKTGMTLPAYIGGMIVAVIMRNVGDRTNKITIKSSEISIIGEVSLSIFLGIAMITLKLWQLASLAVPFLILLVAQTIFMFLFAYFVVFNVMGRDYDAAVLSSGVCGFGMGATPNAMANMQAVSQKYGFSIKAFLLVPIVGGMFVDFLNSLIITLFINIIV